MQVVKACVQTLDLGLKHKGYYKASPFVFMEELRVDNHTHKAYTRPEENVVAQFEGLLQTCGKLSNVGLGLYLTIQSLPGKDH